MLGLFSSLGLTLVLLALAVRLLRRVQTHPRSPADGVPLRVLQRISIGPKQSLAIVQVADRALVVSVGDGGARLLAELGGEALQKTLPAPRETEGKGVRMAEPAALVRRLFGMGLGAAILCLALAIPAGARSIGSPSAAAGTAHPAAAVAAPQAAPQSAGMLAPAMPQVDVRIGQGSNAIHLTGAVGLVVLIGVMTLLPALFLLMTSFTRILIVLQFLRPALGTQTAPPSQLLAALAILLTGVVMKPIIEETNRVAVQPYLHGEIAQEEAYRLGVKPFREFMLANTREKELGLFTELAGVSDALSFEDVPTVTLVSAFVTSELRTAFQMGFLIFLPFVVLDVIVASVLMSLGMFMLPPMMVSLPFKLLLFVIADGWSLVVQNLVMSFHR